MQTPETILEQLRRKGPAKKKQHFSPQFYLRGFAETEPTERIWTYDIEKGEVRGTGVHATAYEGYLYSVTLEDGTQVDALEDVIGDIETKAAPALVKLLAAAPLEPQERMDFASFMAIMHVRTDSFRQMYAEMMGMDVQLRMYASATHEPTFKRMIEDFRRCVRPLDNEEVQRLREGMLDPKDFKLAVKKEATIRALGMHDRLAPIFYEMQWTGMVAPPDREFITSDHPVVFQVPPAYLDPMYGGGLTHKKVELTFPLSSGRCLLATWIKDLAPMIGVNAQTVKEVNRTRSAFARRFLFARRRDEGIAKLGQKYKDVKPSITANGFGPKSYSPVEMRRKW